MTTLETIQALAMQGISIRGVEATVGHKLDETERTAFDKAATVRRLKRAKEAQAAARAKREEAERLEKENLEWWLSDATRNVGDPLPSNAARSATERSRAFRARGREIGPIPPPRHPRVRESCKYNLLRFGLLFGPGTYAGMKPLLRRPPSPRMIRFIIALQDKILHGGLKHVRWPRGKGKSTWVKIAIIWAALYGHKRLMVVVEKIKGMAYVVVEECWKRIYLSPRISADFPEFAIPMKDVELASQRMRSQTYKGRPTYMKQDIVSFCYYRLPVLDGYPNTGSIIAFRGADQALRGINIDSARPDFFFIDDPQTDEDAKNPSTVAKIEENITGAVLGSGQTDERISAVMASTPIEPDDVSERFTDPKLHPEWETETETFVVSWGDESLREVYISKLEEADACPANDTQRKKMLQEDTRQFYIDNRAEIEFGSEMMDDGDFDPASEVSAYQHALWLYHTMKPKKFNSEYQMKPTRSQNIYHITPQIVSSRVNGVDAGVIPSVCSRGVLAFCDVNDEAGLRWELGGFGPQRVLATIAYGQYPREGVALFPENLPEAAKPEYLADALRTVAATILSQSLVDESGEPVKISGICFDGGWMTSTVSTVVRELNAQAGMELCAWSKGFAAVGRGSYSVRHHDMAAKLAKGPAKDNPSGLKAGEECHLWETPNGVFLAYNSDYWKDVSQTSYFAKPLNPSSSSFWGSSPYAHFKFAQEVCNEELIGKTLSPQYGTVWQWKKDASKMNHFGDTHAGLLAYGAIRGFFDPIASMISAQSLQNIQKRKVRYVFDL